MVRLRPLKDGSGYSECSSPDELVGKGRCCHILGDKSCGELTVSQISRGLYEVELEGNKKIKIQSTKNDIIEFFNSLPKISDEKIKKIVDYLSES